MAALMLRGAIFAIFHLHATQALFHSVNAKIFRLPLPFYLSEPVGRVLNRLSADQEAVDVPLGYAWLWLLPVVFRSVGILVLIAMVVPLFLAPMAVLMVVYFGLRHVYRKAARDLLRVTAVTVSPVLQLVTETFHGQRVLCLAPEASRSWWQARCAMALADNHRAKFTTDALSEVWITLCLELIGGTGLLLTAVLIVNSRESVSSAYAGLALAYSINLIVLLNRSVFYAVILEQVMNGVDRLNSYAEMDAEAELEEEDEPALRRHPDEEKQGLLVHTADAEEWPSTGDLRMSGVTVRYPGQSP
jgi:ABC-type multidrug transport system fused ATPase/permease subunit